MIAKVSWIVARFERLIVAVLWIIAMTLLGCCSGVLGGCWGLLGDGLIF